MDNVLSLTFCETSHKLSELQTCTIEKFSIPFLVFMGMGKVRSVAQKEPLITNFLPPKQENLYVAEKCGQKSAIQSFRVLYNITSTPVSGQIKVKNWVYMVVIPWAITSYCQIDIN